MPGLDGFFDSFGKSGGWNWANPFMGVASAVEAPALAKSQGQAAAQMAQEMYAEAQATQARQQAAQQQAFRLADAQSQFAVAQAALQRRYQAVAPLMTRLQADYAAWPGLDGSYSNDAASAKSDADDVMYGAQTSSLPTDPDEVLALATRAQGSRTALDSAVSRISDAVRAAEQEIATRQAQAVAQAAAQADADRAKATAWFSNLQAGPGYGLSGLEW